MAGGVPKNQHRKGLRGESPVSNLQQPSFIATVNATATRMATRMEIKQQRQVNVSSMAGILLSLTKREV